MSGSIFTATGTAEALTAFMGITKAKKWEHEQWLVVNPWRLGPRLAEKFSQLQESCDIQ